MGKEPTARINPIVETVSETVENQRGQPQMKNQNVLKDGKELALTRQSMNLTRPKGWTSGATNLTDLLLGLSHFLKIQITPQFQFRNNVVNLSAKAEEFSTPINGQIVRGGHQAPAAPREINL